MRLLSDQTGQNAQPTEVGARLSISYGHALASLACAVVLLARSRSESVAGTRINAKPASGVYGTVEARQLRADGLGWKSKLGPQNARLLSTNRSRCSLA